MSECPDMSGIDPSVEQFLSETVKNMTEGAVPNKNFGDETIIESSGLVNPGETAAEAHIRIQKERGTAP